MGKKRGKERSPRGDHSIDQSGPTCSHIRKGIDHGLLRKTVLDENWNSCQDCEHEEKSNPCLDDELNVEPQVIWMCLKCGHKGCGRYSENQHAVKHYEKPRSDTHCLVLSLDNWSVWCYICDDDVQYSNTGQLAQLVANIKKQALADPSKKSLAGKVKNEDGAGEAAVAEKTVEDHEDNEKTTEKQRKNTKRESSPKEQNATSVGNSGAVAVKGLSNLGNTCFFNAVVQNLSQTQLLRQLLSEISVEKTSLMITPSQTTKLEPIEIQVDRPGSLTLAMCQLLNEIQETKKGVVTPRELFTQVCKKAARFKGFQQQDSQELLRYLLDGMKAEEMKRVHSGILEALKSSGKSSDAEQSKMLIKDYEKNGVPKNFVDQVFGGEMTSTVMCKECKTVSFVTEMFLDLSLPVADEAFRKKTQKKGGQRSSVSEASDFDSPTPLTNGKEDMPTGAGSKYQQKKAKKQAKKQAKNLRRQQKNESKLTLDDLTSQEPATTTEAAEASSQVENNDDDEEKIPSDTADPVKQDQQKLPEDSQRKEEESEDREEVEQEATSAVVNRFTALSVDENSEDASVEEEKADKESGVDEEGAEERNVKTDAEENQLAADFHSLSLDTTAEDGQCDRENEEECGDTKEYTVVNQDPELAFHTLATRTLPEKQECSVESCLYQFTEVENLTQNNSLLCVTCTKRQSASKSTDGSKKNVYTDALKQMLISSPPPVLTLHLKRFQQVGYSVCKVNRHVQFPQVLDLAPFCTVNCKTVPEGETKVLYSLYGIVEHSGTMRSGHYTAYVKTRPHRQTNMNNGMTTSCDAESLKGSWFYISDSSVQPVSEVKVQSSQAYLLFYERIS
ncbi:ubiquitin carboxyl-terminal hydrolase 16 [Chanos chanos]|uniref:Ubiquitin carboxyl-terminal hydrolase 16 n=1 Tax=Chanos chanos TaxID=29144 RepID=A0A6J2VMZ3_CHACN|nr:ubiquitin carboxyl-terminal hydrolase 16 [Chanos chanos]